MRTYLIKEISEIINGATPSTSNPSYWNGDIVWITPKDLTGFTNRYIYSGHLNITKKGYDSCSTKLLPKGTILLSSRAPIGYLAIAGTELCTNQGFKSIICNSEIVDNRYLYYWLLTKVKYLQQISSGATFKELSKSTLENIEIDLPSLDIQQHIVDTIGSLDNLLDNLKDRKVKIISIIQSKLKEFTSGTIDFSELKPEIIKSGIYSFDKEKFYIDTSSVEGINNISNGEIVTFKKRPSRANMQPVSSSVWFAKMKGSNKIILVTDKDNDLIDSNIFSTGFLGIRRSDKLPISYLMAIITSKEFKTQRDLNSVGTTMAGINNNTLLKINVPKLDEMSIPLFKEICNPLVLELSNIRKKTNSIKKLKERLLEKYF